MKKLVKKSVKAKKKSTARDLALAKIADAKSDLKFAQGNIAGLAREASEKRKVAEKALRNLNKAHTSVYKRSKVLTRAKEVLIKLDEKRKVAEEAKLAKAALKAEAKAAKTSESEAAAAAAATVDDDDDMGDDAADENWPKSEDDMGADDDESVEA